MHSCKYIAFESIPSAGKSTQIKNLQEYVNKNSIPDIKFVFEPGSTEIANAIRKVVQGSHFEEKMDYWTEALLYTAARSQLLHSIVKPHLASGGRICSDRSFVTTFAYQGFIRGLGINDIWSVNKYVVGELIPDYIIYFDIDVETAYQRRNDLEGDKFEREGLVLFYKIAQGYKKASQCTIVKDRWISIDANKSIEEVFGRLIQVLKDINFIN